MNKYNITNQYKLAHDYYDRILNIKIESISKLSGVNINKLIKINPADFIEENPYQYINNYKYIKIGQFIKKYKTDETYLISPLDSDVETANQIAYKENNINEKIRASKCECIPISSNVATNFFIKNHRQSLPNISSIAVSFGLVYKNKLVGVMTYDKTHGGIRGKLEDYKLLRLAFAHGYRVHGGASKLQNFCESALYKIGEKKVISYSNATINNGNVYRALGFNDIDFKQGQPFVIMNNFELIRLIQLVPQGISKNSELASNGLMKCHLGGNKKWIKDIKYNEKYDYELNEESDTDGNEFKE